ncbi:DNA-binding transcriptional regulator, CsgD family [Hyunsoonleella jejuensis]|uniref:DNA-binding transcriptional regulator, CsgD family n=1 Tax=Hyunsoonleella jejuensis TaxID=419940 RepID=A0A1H9H4E4_9FLAO|nr:tetratricopeptide repeat protein [Hyunsoonleella jejuensis]SEQ57221.1 DNA-binding transcriptional regulator, CsgD family [Hyunsoonleella jejuensis]
MKKFIYYVLIFSFPLCIIQAQNKELIDSLKYELKQRKVDDSTKVSILINLNKNLKYSKPEEAKAYALQSIEISNKINNRFGIAAGNMHIGDYYLNKSENDSALYYYDIAKKNFEAISYTRGLIFINHAISIVKETSGDLDEAITITKENLKLIEETEDDNDPSKIKFLGAHHDALSIRYAEKGSYKIALTEAFKALAYFEQAKDTRRAGALEQIGIIQSTQKNYEEAIKYYKQATEIYEQEHQEWSLTYVNTSLGSSYKKLDDYPNAKKHYQLAIKYAKDFEDKFALSDAIIGVAELELENENYAKAKTHFLEVKTIAEKENYKLNLANALHGLSKIAYENKDYETAFKYNDEAIQLARPNNALAYLKRFYPYRAKILQAQNNYKEAIVYLDAYQEVSDSLYSIAKTQQIEELKTIYETEKKEQQIALQETKIDLLEKQGEVSTLYIILLGFGLLLALIAFYALRQKLKRSKAEREKLNLELDFKKKELTTHALHLAKKNEVLENLKQQAKTFKTSENSQKGFNQLIRTINFDLKDDNNWDNFSRYFEQVHTNFSSNVKQKFPEVTPNELRLMALLKMNLSSKEIASILNISTEGVKKARYRLRKKMDITTEDSLQDLILNL